MADGTALAPADVTSRVDARHWRVVRGRLHATFRTGDFVTGHRLVGRMTEVAEELGHHPDVVLRYPAVHVSVVSHDVGALTGRDVALAARLSALVDEAGIEAVPGASQSVEVAIDALDVAAVRPFWRAVLGYVDDPHDEQALVDPDGLGPGVWFEQTDEPRPQSNRVHLDVSVPHDVAEARVRAALDAGGTLVSDRRAPASWVLADAEGNEVCVCTWQDR